MNTAAPQPNGDGGSPAYPTGPPAPATPPAGMGSTVSTGSPADTDNSSSPTGIECPISPSSPSSSTRTGSTAAPLAGVRRSLRSKLPLRSRLALLTALAVAFAVALSAVACWVITREQLRDELDKSLRNYRVNVLYLRDTLQQCPQIETAPSRDAGPSVAYVQTVNADAGRCVGTGAKPVRVSDSDVNVALGLENDVVRDGRTDGGTPVRVLTKSYVIGDSVFAVSLSRPLTETDSALDTLALVLAVVAGIGVLGAATAGLAVARAGLRPVDRLTGAVEHIARTEDLATTIPVEGRDEIARLSRSFNSMTAALASSRDRQQQLIADAGHELRTPLTSLRMNVELLVRSEETGRALPPDDRRELLASVKAQMTELAALIGDLQELSRPDAPPGSGAPRIAALHEAASAAVERARLRGKDLAITARLTSWYVPAEPSALERAVINLLDNAVKFSPPGGAVEVTLSEGVLTVRDHGPGIPSDELPHVFDRFWRSPSARSLPGSGLGLSIVARTVQRSGGEVSLRAADGGGTVAVVRLPGAPHPPPEAEPSQGGPAGGGPAFRAPEP
ncbi:sensor histidine kinase [Streptomyces zagrosensis]|uniref:histidine kinase n=1 Tax=Streptomyces zagrosensis TaxID=1042984 RepID=A0A7W9Q6A9_9ACTN|nr:HAMP domain-containing sensor histidine kinase [Streptomyces zagrosensis]MBB5934430.1 two-component system sensor histidine kinase MprB [Streptomyces zagrosensis]